MDYPATENLECDRAHRRRCRKRSRWVIMGNHRDAWTFGAVDPEQRNHRDARSRPRVWRVAGRKVGNRDARSCFVVGTAKMYGLLGSTEWAEDNAEELRQKAVVYLNVDSAVSGSKLWRLFSAVDVEIDSWRDPRYQRSKVRADGLSACGRRARKMTSPTAEMASAEAASRCADCRGPHRRPGFRFRLHAVSATPRNSGQRHGFRRRLRRLSFCV